MEKDKLLIIFAKEPRLGNVKTRLAKEIGDKKALAIYLSLLRRAFKIFKKPAYDVRVYFTPRKETLKKLLPRKVILNPQKGRSLGSRMFNAFKDNLKNYNKIVTIGVDCPFINKSLIKKAFSILLKYPIVLGPAKDGGYYLIGLSKLYPSIFKDIQWGTSKVLKQTLKQCKLLGIKPFLLKKLYDIDTVSDLKRWKKQEK